MNMAYDKFGSLDSLKQCAGNIKVSQLAERRKKFDKLPSFVQAGLFLYEKFINVRKQEFFPKMLAFDMLRMEGNNLFSDCRYEEAARKYEEVGYYIIKQNRH